MKIVSFGGGVQSTALAILAATGKIEVDAFVFCDTGFEQSIVFDFLEKHTLPLLNHVGIPFYTAKTEEYAGTLHGETTFGSFLLPPFFIGDGDGDAKNKQPAFCSSKWKADVFNKFCEKEFGAKKYDVSLGFSTDEKQRAASKLMGEKDYSKFISAQYDLFVDSSDVDKKLYAEIERYKKKNTPKKWRYNFPLLDLRMNRGDCVKIVQDTFNAPPPRSSCYFCPNHTQHEWRKVMSGSDRDKVIAIDEKIRSSLNGYLNNADHKAFLTVECKPIAECEFDDKNEVIFSRLCAGGCFL